MHLVVPQGLAARTGGFAYDRRLVDGLRDRGWSVTVHELGPDFPRPSPGALSAAAETLRAIPSGDNVVVDGLALGGMPAIAADQASRLRLVALVHHPLAEETGLDPAARRALHAAEQRALAAVAHVIVTSHATARALSAYGIDPASVTVAEPGTDPAPLAAARGMPPLRLVCVATVTPRKGHALLLDALASLRDRPWRLDCIGSTRRDQVTAHAVARQVESLGLSDRVRFHGEVDDAALERAYARADAFVLASYYEGYGMAFAEALARGLPIVATGGGAVAETVPGTAGLLAPAGDAKALSAALRRLLDEPGLYGHLREGARAARERLPGWDQAVERVAGVLSGEAPA